MISRGVLDARELLGWTELAPPHRFSIGIDDDAVRVVIRDEFPLLPAISRGSFRAATEGRRMGPAAVVVQAPAGKRARRGVRL
jgi:hypothetical protein